MHYFAQSSTILAIGQALTMQQIFKENVQILVEASPYPQDNIQKLGKVLVILQRSYFLFYKQALRGETELANSRADTIMN